MRHLLAVIVFTLFSFKNAQAYQVHSPEANVYLTTGRVAYLTGYITPVQALNFTLALSATSHLPGPRVLVIDSPGGSVTAGKEELDALLEEKTRTHEKLVCVVTGAAMSMAFNILTRCDVRLAVPGAAFLFHDISAGVLSDSAGFRLTRTMLRMIADDLESVGESYRRWNAWALRMKLKEYDEAAERDLTWEPSELLERKYLHGMATVKQ